MNQKISTGLGTIVLVIMAFTAGIFVWMVEKNQSARDGQVVQNYFAKNKKTKQVACTEEAKLCPDGSYVARTGPNCEFAKCPENRQTYKNEKYGFEFRYPKNWSVSKTDSANDLTLSDEQGEKIISMNFADSTVMGISFCEQNTKNANCELIKINGESRSFTVDWNNEKTAQAFVSLSSKERLYFKLLKSDDLNKNIFRQILSTFKFTK